MLRDVRSTSIVQSDSTAFPVSKMKFSTLATALTASSAAALSIPARDNALRTIKLSPTEIKQVTDEEKWELLKVCDFVPSRLPDY
jgi:hypothetical protein